VLAFAAMRDAATVASPFRESHGSGAVFSRLRRTQIQFAGMEKREDESL